VAQPVPQIASRQRDSREELWAISLGHEERLEGLAYWVVGFAPHYHGGPVSSRCAERSMLKKRPVFQALKAAARSAQATTADAAGLRARQWRVSNLAGGK
jgi:hypothetical protein